MKKALIIQCYLLISIFFLFNQEDNENLKPLIKRTVTILPFINSNKIDSYNYLSQYIRDNIKIELEDAFNIIDSSDSLEKIKDLNIDMKSMPKDEMLTKIGLDLRSDIIIYGNFIIEGDKIDYSLKVFDIITNETVINISYKGELGYDLTRYINTFIQESKIQIFEKLRSYNQKIINKFLIKDKLDKNFRLLIDNLLDQSDRYWYFSFKKGSTNKQILIPFAKNVLIFVCEQTGEYSINYKDQQDSTNSNVKILAFDINDNNKKEIKISLNKSQQLMFNYQPINNYEVFIKYLEFFSKIEVGKYTAFIDNYITGTTSGYLGFDLKAGFGLPLKTMLENNLYIRTSFSPKLLNYIDTSDLGKHFIFDRTHYKLKLGIGYEHVFYIKSIVGIHLGFEAGVEFNWFSFLVKDNILIPLDELMFGYPAIYYSIPIEVQFIANKRISLIIGFDPVLRLAINCFVYQNKIYLETLDETRGYGLNIFRIQTNNFITIDTAFYDMPVYIGFRVKI